MKIFRRLSLLALGALAPLTAAAAAKPADFGWPRATREARPWMRWWWMGSIGTEDGLRAALRQYAAAGFGGLEITPVYGVRGQEPEFIDFLSPRWVNRVEFILREATALGLEVDLSSAAGWPMGGPWVEGEHAARFLAHRSFTVPAGGQLDDPVQLVQDPVLRLAGPAGEPAPAITEPIRANGNLQELAIDQVRFEKPIPLAALMAFPAAGGAPVDLTGNVGPDGKLEWTAPANQGDWALHAVFAGWHGKMVERAAPGGEGMVIDHLRGDALRAHLAALDGAFAGRDLAALRGFTNGPYAVDESEGDADFTPGFFEAFLRLRGYDLRGELPALFAEEAGDRQSRVLADYRETVSDLLLEELTVPWQQWAAGHGAVARNRAQGAPANLLDLFAASDIPCAEGGDVLAVKLASSAAHLAGRALISADSGAWLDEHFLVTLGDLKRAVDGSFLGGANQIGLHGTAYSPPDEPWPGFLFYAPAHLNPADPLWPHLPALNGYITRAQSFLQAGQPDEDVLVYYNIHDRRAARGGGLPHFRGETREGVTARDTGEALLAAGHTFDFVSDRALAGLSCVEGAVRSTSGARYRAVVVPRTELIPAETMTRLVALAAAGATIVIESELPRDVPGLGRLEERRAALRDALAQIDFGEAGGTGVRRGTVGSGRVLIGDDPIALLAAAGVAREPMVDRGLRFIRRVDGEDRVYFIVNPGREKVRGVVPLTATSRAVGLFNPMSGEFGVAFTAPTGEAGTPAGVFLDLNPGESLVVQSLAVFPEGGISLFFFRQPMEGRQRLAGPWRVQFMTGGPALPAALETKWLESWTRFEAEGAPAFSGTAVYSTTFRRPAGVEAPEGWWLDLGDVAESARVRLNGIVLGTVFMPPYRVKVPDALVRRDNALEIEVASLAANRIADLDRRGVAWKKFYNANLPAKNRENAGDDGLFTAQYWTPQESGLLGPVTLVPLATASE